MYSALIVHATSQSFVTVTDLLIVQDLETSTERRLCSRVLDVKTGLFPTGACSQLLNAGVVIER